MMILINLMQAFYLPWAMLVLDVLFGSEIVPDLIGIIAGHLYYFLAVLHPLATGRNILKTPQWLYPLNVGDVIYISLHVHTQALQSCIHTQVDTECYPVIRKTKWLNFIIIFFSFAPSDFWLGFG